MIQPMFTPIMVSMVRNGVPLPDWDGDLEKWAMSAHLSSAYADALSELREAMDKYEAMDKPFRVIWEREIDFYSECETYEEALREEGEQTCLFGEVYVYCQAHGWTLACADVENGHCSKCSDAFHNELLGVSEQVMIRELRDADRDVDQLILSGELEEAYRELLNDRDTASECWPYEVEYDYRTRKWNTNVDPYGEQELPEEHDDPLCY